MRRMIGMLGACAMLAGCSSGGGGGMIAGERVEVNEERTATSRTWVYFVEPVRGQHFVKSPTEGELSRVAEQHERLEGLIDQGIVLLAGPTMDPPYTSMVIFKAPNRAEAERIMFDDPAIKFGVFKPRLAPMKVSMVGDID